MVQLCKIVRNLIYVGDFPGDSVVRNQPANAGDAGWIPRPGSSPGKGNGNSLQYSCLGIPRQRSLVGYKSLGSQKGQT